MVGRMEIGRLNDLSGLSSYMKSLGQDNLFPLLSFHHALNGASLYSLRV